MVTKLPTNNVRGLELSESQIFRHHNHGDNNKSLLHPLRKQKKRSPSSAIKVCTVEAVVSALLALSAITITQAQSIVTLADVKVQRTAEYQGKMPRG